MLSGSTFFLYRDSANGNGRALIVDGETLVRRCDSMARQRTRWHT